MRTGWTTAVVLTIALCLAAGLAVATRRINFWPTDAKAYYFDAAVRLPQMRYLSQMHASMDSERVRWLHGKEILILCVSLMQRLLHDIVSLRPFVYLFILAQFFSSVLIYLIARRYLGTAPAVVCFSAYAGSFWPYMYILFAKHQLLGLVFFLFAVYAMQQPGRGKGGWHFLSGVSLGLSFFSSPASALYAPLYAGAFFFRNIPAGAGQKTAAVARGLLWGVLCAGLGVAAVIVYVNRPGVLGHLAQYFEYVFISGRYNHFYYNQPYLQQWFGLQPVAVIRGGWPWVGKYFFLIMPVLFPFVLLLAGCLAVSLFRRQRALRRLETVAAFLVSAAPLLMIEKARVAQYGGNYFPVLAGLVFFAGYATRRVLQDWKASRFYTRRGSAVLCVAAAGLAALQGAVNARIFIRDIYTCRMATTLFSEKLKSLQIKKFYTYRRQPHRDLFVPYLNPEVYEGLEIIPVDSLLQASDGYLLLPPVTGDSIFLAATSSYADYDADDLLNELIASGRLPDYAVIDQPTLASSGYWLQEEEILSYRALMLGQDLPVKDFRSHLMLIDARKVVRDLPRNIPRGEFQRARRENIRNIGSAGGLFVFRGVMERVSAPVQVRNLMARVAKKGAPADAIRAYAYQLDTVQPVWVPAGRIFFSRPVPAAAVAPGAQGGLVNFSFDPPLEIQPGICFFVVYRTGPKEEENYYQIFMDDIWIPWLRRRE